MKKLLLGALTGVLALAGVSVAGALTSTPSVATFTYTVPAQTFTQSVTVPTVTVTTTVVSTVTAPAATTTAPMTTTSSTPAPTSACSLYASPNGSDANQGTLSSPLATVKKLIQSLAAGQTGCLTPGTFTGTFTLYSGDTHGTQAAPVTVTSLDPASPATIWGRVVTQTGADNLTFTHLRFNWNAAGALSPSITVGSQYVTFDHDDVTNGNTMICFDLVNSSTYGVARHTTIANSRVHDCGRLPYGSTNNDHGIYDSGYSTLVENNLIYRNSDRGVQLRGAQGALIQHNIIDGNGEGVIFGDLGASNNRVTDNIVSNSRVRWNAESWWGTGTVGTGNSFDSNCVWATNTTSSYNSNGGVSGGAGYTASANRTANPAYVDAATGNYTLSAGSPCAGDGPTTSSIGA